MNCNIEVRKSADRLLGLLVGATLLILFLDVFHFFTGLLENPIFDVEYDHGIGQIFRIAQEFGIVLMLLLIAVKRWRFLCISWASLFGMLLVDDCLSLHEQFGLAIAEKLQLPTLFGMMPRNLGEMIVYGSWGVVLMSLVIVAHFRSHGEARRFSMGLFGLLAILVFFGGFMDMVQGMVHHVWMHAAFGKLEDGGTMIMISVLVWYVFQYLYESDPWGSRAANR